MLEELGKFCTNPIFINDNLGGLTRNLFLATSMTQLLLLKSNHLNDWQESSGLGIMKNYKYVIKKQIQVKYLGQKSCLQIYCS